MFVLYVCMYVCTYVFYVCTTCLHVCMYVFGMYLRGHLTYLFFCEYTYMNVCMYVCMYVCMHACTVCRYEHPLKISALSSPHTLSTTPTWSTSRTWTTSCPTCGRGPCSRCRRPWPTRRRSTTPTSFERPPSTCSNSTLGDGMGFDGSKAENVCMYVYTVSVFSFLKFSKVMS